MKTRVWYNTGSLCKHSSFYAVVFCSAAYKGELCKAEPAALVRVERGRDGVETTSPAPEADRVAFSKHLSDPADALVSCKIRRSEYVELKRRAVEQGCTVAGYLRLVLACEGIVSTTLQLEHRRGDISARLRRRGLLGKG